MCAPSHRGRKGVTQAARGCPRCSTLGRSGRDNSSHTGPQKTLGSPSPVGGLARRPLALCRCLSTPYFSTFLRVATAGQPTRGSDPTRSYSSSPRGLNRRISRGAVAGGAPRGQWLCEADLVPNACLPPIDVLHLGQRPTLVAL